MKLKENQANQKKLSCFWNYDAELKIRVYKVFEEKPAKLNSLDEDMLSDIFEKNLSIENSNNTKSLSHRLMI